MLIDRATIFVRSGKGGAGCMSFRREKYVPNGGPEGGDGGRGGDVVLVGDAGLTTLLPLTPRPHYRAANGRPGKGKSMRGADGEDSIVRVPLGTLVLDAETGALLVDIDREGQRCVVARGGAGGLGNEHFKSPTNQAPRQCTPGAPWEERTLRLELKLIADIGLVGLPNAGKSTLLRATSRATPKVADYPFTTVHPHLGIAELSDARRIVVADIPGLIEGAAAGAGLGHDFLRHLERTTVLVHVIDVTLEAPDQSYQVVRGELAGYAAALAAKPELIALNKIDLIPRAEREAVVDRIAAVLPADRRVLTVSATTGEGTADLLEACWLTLGREEPPGWKVDGRGDPAEPSGRAGPRPATGRTPGTS